ncbi:MAG: ABC transporter substrate-binding protein [Xanthobacteraceae bacterium]
MKRREFITLLGGAAASWPLAAGAQQSAMPVIGVLDSEADELFRRGLQQGLSESGYAEGKNLAIEYRSAEGRNDRLAALAADLVRRQVAVIVASSTPATAAAKAATTTIPIVFTAGADPVAAGFVASLSRPGGNITGVSLLLSQVVPKQFEMLREVLPTASTIAFLYNPTNRALAKLITKEAQAAADSLGLKLQVLEASTEGEIDKAFTDLTQMRADGLVIGPDLFFTERSSELAALAALHALPAIYHSRGFAAAGGLMSYGTSLADAYRLLGGYVGRILKGEKPADLPVQQVTKLELILNLKTAKALGLTVPLPLLGRADEVIE